MGWIDDLAGIARDVLGPVGRVLNPLRLSIRGDHTGSGQSQYLGLMVGNRNTDAPIRARVVEFGGLRYSQSATPWQPPWEGGGGADDREIIKGDFSRLTLLTTRSGDHGDDYPRYIVLSEPGTGIVVSFSGVADPERCDPRMLVGAEAHLRVRIWNRNLRKHRDWIVRFGIGPDYKLWWRVDV